MKSKKPLRNACALALACSLAIMMASTAQARKLFEVTVTGGAPTVTAENSSFPDLLQDVIKGQGKFASFSMVDYNGLMTYLGVPNAIQVNMTGNTATIDLPSIGFSRTFTGSSRDDVYDQVEDYFLKHGSDIYGRFLKEMAKRSAVALTDGNPGATTARMAAGTFFTDGFTPSDELMDMIDGITTDRFSGLGIGFNGGEFEAGDFTGYYADFALPWRKRLAGHVDLNTSLNFNYLDVEGSQVFGIGATIGVPVRVLIMDREHRWNWRLTPVAGISARGSEDMASGGLIWMAGGLSTVDFRVNSRLILSIVNQVSYHKSMNLKLPDDYEFDPHVDQVILKNGLRAVTRFGKRIIADAFAIETNFLNDAAVDSFTTIGGSLKWQATQKYHLTLGANYDWGDDYKSWSVGLSSVWNF